MKTATITRLSDRALSDNVDRLGAINAEIAALKTRADDIKAKLIDSGRAEIEGKAYRAVISTRDTVRLDSKIVRGFLTPAEIAAASRVSTSTNVTLYDL